VRLVSISSNFLLTQYAADCYYYDYVGDDYCNNNYYYYSSTIYGIE